MLRKYKISEKMNFYFNPYKIVVFHRRSQPRMSKMMITRLFTK